MTRLRRCLIAIGSSICLLSSSVVSAQDAVEIRRSVSKFPISYASMEESAESAASQQIAPVGCCDLGCADSGCGSVGCGSLESFRLLSLIKPSDHCFNDFISPMTNPVFFEDPRNLTEARAIFLNHRAPAAVGGGSVQLYAMQVRASLTDNISLIATKDGYVNSSNPLIGDGWADISAGLKFNLMRDEENGRMLSGGFTYEVPTGEAAPLQGNGSGELNLFLTGARRIGCNAHWMGAAGWRLPMDGADESQSVYFSNHLDYQLTQRWYLLAESNWYHWTKSGSGGIPGVEGLDLFNLGSQGVTGNDIVTAAVGTKFKPNRHTEIGVAWEFPLTQRRDIIDDRLTVDWVIRY